MGVLRDVAASQRAALQQGSGTETLRSAYSR
jgi:hypothetical protein